MSKFNPGDRVRLKDGMTCIYKNEDIFTVDEVDYYPNGGNPYTVIRLRETPYVVYEDWLEAVEDA